MSRKADMKAVLVGSDKDIVIQDARRFLSRDFSVNFAPDAPSCLKTFQQKRHDFAFIDIDFLGGVGGAESFHKFPELLQPYSKAGVCESRCE
ncbi:MAG: hypothetical protein HY788_14390 [Deltaproteobacteria bacterium]|nr:hypothetical protein [Deltaproteobacteria bacterium]